MASHTVVVTLVSQHVIADPNPLEVDPKDDVTWDFSAAPGLLRVEFQAFLTRDSSPPDIGTRSNPFKPPFPPSSGPTVGTGTIRDDAEPGLYIYNIVDASTGVPVKWQTHLLQALNNQLLPAGFEAFFGGIIIRDPPGQPAPPPAE